MVSLIKLIIIKKNYIIKKITSIVGFSFNYYLLKKSFFQHHLNFINDIYYIYNKDIRKIYKYTILNISYFFS
jgi:hypothetical protein